MKKYRKYGKEMIMAMLILGIFMLILAAYVSTPMCKVHKCLNEIDENIDEIVLRHEVEGHEINPYACFQETSSYKELVSMGDEALPVLCNGLKTSRDSGFKEYVMCIAIEDITGTDIQEIPEYTWDNPRQFLEKWESYLREVPDRICAVLDSDISPEKKAWELKCYGLLAVPVLDKRMMEGKLDEEMQQYLKKLVKDNVEDEKLETELSLNELHKVICKYFYNMQKYVLEQ